MFEASKSEVWIGTEAKKGSKKQLGLVVYLSLCRPQRAMHYSQEQAFQAKFNMDPLVPVTEP